MATSYELWDVETGNCVGLYADEAAALAAVRATLREDGAGAVETLALARVDGRAAITPIAAGRDLVALVAAPVSP